MLQYACVHFALLQIVLTSDPFAVPLVRLNRCGPVALFVCAEAIGHPRQLTEIESSGPQDDRKWTFADLQNVSAQIGFQTAPLQFASDPISWTPGQTAAIARIFLSTGESHYVTIVESRGSALVISDFPHPPTPVSTETLRQKYGWDGSLLFVFTDAAFGNRLFVDQISPRTIYVSAALLFVLAAALLFSARRTPHTAPANSHHPRHGFTIVEVLVSMGIVTVLLALLMPAIQMTRSRAQMASCTNNLHQIGLAMAGFESAHDCYPNPNQLPRIPTDVPQDVRAIFAPHVGLLPWLDQVNIESQIDFRNDPQNSGDGDPASSTLNGNLLRQSISVFVCPADTVPPGGDSYRACTGTSPALHTTPQLNRRIAALRGWHGGAKTGSRDVTDGLSHTVFFAERTTGDKNPRFFTPFRDVALQATGNLLLPDDAVRACSLTVPAQPPHLSFVGSTWLYFGYLHTAYNHILEPNARIIDCTTSSNPDALSPGAYTPRSLHPGGVNVLMGDGSVRFISSSIDRILWRSLGSISGGEPIGEF